SFFPQLVAGPIERASNLLPQFAVERKFDYTKSIDGLRQILWGLFKKVIIADLCANAANIIFNNSADHTGGTLLMGGLFFVFQVYADFSGYSDIAIGTARLFGFNLMQNFAYPYTSTSIQEFWARWHISLYTWFNDYLFMPLAFMWRSLGEKGVLFAIMVTFLCSGLWHGAAWKFIVFGGLHGFALVLESLTKNGRQKIFAALPPFVKPLIGGILTFSFVTLTFIIFRAENLSHGYQYIKAMLIPSLPVGSAFLGTTVHPFTLFVFLAIFFSIEWKGRNSQFALANFGLNWHKIVRLGFYFLIAITTLLFSGRQQEFIYFQF
ncbi:MAG: MBOAT family protein, partial [Flavobacteriales bacterium]|nr:MBOAT family protein [Flavobacteriales bacterium]